MERFRKAFYLAIKIIFPCRKFCDVEAAERIRAFKLNFVSIVPTLEKNLMKRKNS